MGDILHPPYAQYKYDNMISKKKEQHEWPRMWRCSTSFEYSWIGPQVHAHEKLGPENRKDYSNAETTNEKLSARRIQIFWIHFVWSIFDLFFKITFQMMSEQK